MVDPGGRWLTGAEVCTRIGATRSGLRSLVARATAAGVDLRAPRAVWPDGRTPMYDAQLVDEYRNSRPGRGRKVPAP